MTFIEFTDSMLEIVLTVVIPSLVLMFKTEISAFIRSYVEKVENEKIKDYLEFANAAVFDAVEAVSQTFVDNLKKKGKFDQTAMQEAFEMAKINAEKVISDDIKHAVEMVYNDFDKWLETHIESYVKSTKTSYATAFAPVRLESGD